MFTVKSLAEMNALAANVAARMLPGVVIRLDGTLGAGKTHFVKALASTLGYPGNVSSPTFPLVHEYRWSEKVLYHLDFYRLQSADEVFAAGLDDYLPGEGMAVVEWAGRFPEAFLPGSWQIDIVVTGKTHREVTIESSSVQASVALFVGSELSREETFPSGRGPVTRVFSILERFLSGLGTLDEIIVGVGPGSYSGIRIGLSAAIGLKLAREIPAVGIVSALGYPGTDYQVVLDARGSWTYLSVVENKMTTEPVNLSQEELLGKVDPHRRIYSDRPMTIWETTCAFPLASILGQRALDDPQFARLPLLPLYLKAPHITESKAAPILAV